MRFFAVAAALLLATLPASAQERANTILVMDGSGSMWGQIEGINKIVIAREVVSQILEDFPADENLGLTVYGHRERGNCADIETIVPPGTNTVPSILDAVNAINPRGKTPMTDAIIAAAEALRYTEEAATVILISDGIETCNPDPCAAARALEQAGIDFTAHVVGFDVTEPEALAQMQCLADETGGQFITASNADELTDALNQVTVEPEVVTYPVTFVATRGEGGPVEPNVLWDILDPDGLIIDGNVDTVTGELVFQSAPNVLTLQPWSYNAQAYGIAEEIEGSTSFQVIDEAITVTVILPELEPVLVPVTFRAVIGAEDGPDITDTLVWTLLSDDGSITEGERPNPITMNLEEGSHTITAYWGAQETEVSRQFIASGEGREIVLVFPEPQVAASLLAPASAPLGSMVEVGWDGPGADGDYIAVSDPEAGGYINYTYTRDGNPLMLLMPPAEGTYELRYFADGGEVLATRTITATPVDVSLTATDTAVAGETIPVEWTGPDYDLDFIAVGLPGEGYENYTYTRDGNPAQLVMPTEPGTYELRYTLSQDSTIIATRPITVVDVQATLTAPDTAIVGQPLEVTWTGPDYDLDYIAVGVPGEGGYINYTYTRDGSPLMLDMPTEPGTYELRYTLSQDSEIIATRPITITAVESSLTAPDTAIAGETIMVGWTGPDYDLDYIAVGVPGESGYINYTYTRDGSPLEVVMPTEPGEYELRYTLRQDSEVIATRPITVTAVQATLTAPDTADIGASVQVDWTGPDYDLDFIAVGVPGERGYINYTYTREGSPLMLDMPTEPGTYELRYTLRQDSEIIATRPIVVEGITVSLTAPDTAVAGSTVAVVWDGPDYDLDFIAVSNSGESGYVNYTYTRDGSPAQLLMPVEPGEYEIRYTMRQDSTVVHRIPITITPVSASLVADPTVALSAETILVGWDGPDYAQDFIGISEIGNPRYERFAYTSTGNPVMVRLPDAPGDYEIRYYLRQDSTVIATIPLTVTDD